MDSRLTNHLISIRTDQTSNAEYANNDGKHLDLVLNTLLSTFKVTKDYETDLDGGKLMIFKPTSESACQSMSTLCRYFPRSAIISVTIELSSADTKPAGNKFHTDIM